jgi:hypothetical protein
MAILFKNNAASTLKVGLNVSSVTMAVVDPSVFPVISENSGDTFKLTLVGDDVLEIIEVTSIYEDATYGTAYRIKRGQEGTDILRWPSGTRVEMRITAGALNSFVPTAVQLAKDYVDATGVASTTNVGFAGVDGKTTQANAEGVVTAKDVAIGGDLGDLASARGQIGELKVATAAEYPSILTIRKSCRLYFNGTEWAQVADRPFEAGYGAVVIADVSSGALRGEIWAFSLSGNDAWKAQFNEKGTSPFARFVMSNAIGDGIRVTNGIISVPEYDGATASTSGTSGLVPPATAGQQESFLTGGGEYKPALTKISDSVSLEDSTTAASAKAVKTAYDLASAALPKSGGTISGDIFVVGGITVAAPDGESEGGQILLKNGTDGSYPVVIDTTQNQIRFLSGPGGPNGFVSVDLETVRFVGNLTGKADSAHLADNTYSLAGRPWLEDLYTDSPGWVIGSVDGQLRPINTGSLKVLAADHIISGSFAYGRASDGFYLPNGGSWFVFCTLDNDLSHGSSANAVPIMAAGGSRITWSFNGTGYTWIGIKVL